MSKVWGVFEVKGRSEKCIDGPFTKRDAEDALMKWRNKPDRAVTTLYKVARFTLLR